MPEMVHNVTLLLGGFMVLVLVLCGALLVGIGLFTLLRYKVGGDWPQAAGVIESSEVVPEKHFEGDQFYRPVLRYRYSAPGGSYVGDKLATTGRLYPKEAAAKKVAARYPVGATVMVHYNPADPSEAILEHEFAGGFWFILFGLLCWIVPTVALLQAGLDWPWIALIFAILSFVPTLMMVRGGSSLAKARSRGLCPPAGEGSDADVLSLASRGEKLLAIHLYRELHGSGLKESRQAVEALLRNEKAPRE